MHPTPERKASELACGLGMVFVSALVPSRRGVASRRLHTSFLAFHISSKPLTASSSFLPSTITVLSSLEATPSQYPTRHRGRRTFLLRGERRIISVLVNF
ncbi:hypothetical protein K1719_007083 [Acacia pycnantha]|nr:hypothetical protein K1719_007083 [Acacia pycnantha]